jgi:O-antigen/teichoic acid export membrane protein
MSSLAAGDQEAAGSGRFLLTVNFVFVTTVLSYGLGFLAVVLVSRELGPDGRGVTALYQSIVTVSFILLSSGAGSAVVYFVRTSDITGRQALESGLTVTLAAAAVAGVGVLVAALLFDDRLRSEGLPYWLAVIAIPGLIQVQLFEMLFRGQGRFAAMNALNLSVPLCLLLAFVVVYLVAGLSISRVVTIWSLAMWPPVLFGYALAGPALWPRALTPLARLKPLLVFGAQSQSGNLVQLLNYRLDSYLILIMVNAAGVGLYATGVSLSEGLWFIANSAAVVLMTRITAGDEEYVRSMTPLVCRSTLLVTSCAAIGAAAVSPFVIPAVFGSRFEDAVVPFLCLLPGTVALAGGKILSAYVFSRGRPMINTAIAVATLVVTIVADLILIPPLEVTGAAIGASIAYGVSLALTAVAYRRLSGAPILEALVPRPSDANIAFDAARSIAARFAAR